MQQGGDDLDDDFVANDLNDLSDGENTHAQVDEHKVYFSDEETTVPLPSDRIPKKRKKEGKEKQQEAKAKKRKLVLTVGAQSGADGPLAAQPPVKLLEYLSSKQLQSFPKLSTIELGDLQIPEGCIADTTAWDGSRALDQLVDFIIKVVPSLHIRLSQYSKSNGSPTLLFVAGAALRAADVIRMLRSKRLRGEKGGEVAKLFAKHLKVPEQVAILKGSKVGAGVGTPGRIGKLLCDTDALHVSALSHIILDVTYRDSKNRSLLDIPETRDELFKTVLGAPQVLKAIKDGKISIVLF